MKSLILALVVSVSCIGICRAADPAPAAPAPRGPKQARSVHLTYAPQAPKARVVEGTVTVTETQPHTYFAIICCDRGYCGVQDLGPAGHVFLFSVWEPGDPMNLKARADQVAEDIRAKVVYCAPGTEASRFGGEGTGAKTMTKFDWKVGEPVSARIEVDPDGERTAFTCHVRKGTDGAWRKIATISTLGAKSELGRVYSFVEDFARNYTSATLVRRAEFSGFRSRTDATSAWVPAMKAQFTGDPTPTLNVDAGRTASGSFFLQTGGATRNEHVRLWGTVE
ncbi:MAG: DUF3472 domain-containing protein [Kiritimatiellia bacterium]